MATSAFKSTTKRTPIGTNSTSDDSSTSSSKPHRRSRSLSRFSRRLPDSDCRDAPSQRGKFVNTIRGSGFTEISLDDLAVEFFPSNREFDDKRETERRRSPRRRSEISKQTPERRGRSVCRHDAVDSDGKSGVYNNSCSDANLRRRRRRSVSVAGCRISDSESLFSRLNDHKATDARYGRSEVEKTICAVYAQNKVEHPIGEDENGDLYQAMKKELRYAVEEIRTDLEQMMVKERSTLGTGDSMKTSENDHQAVSAITNSYASKLEQSEKRKQDLLAKILLEEQRGKELLKIVKELLRSNSNTMEHKPSRARKRSIDRNRMSKRLNEEAEKIFDDFLSNIEDTDISSIDEERSDASSNLGGISKQRELTPHHVEKTPANQGQAAYIPRPVEMDGVILPWLQWETSDDLSPFKSNSKMDPSVATETISWDDDQDSTSMQDSSGHPSSRAKNWSPGLGSLSSSNGKDRLSSSKEVKSFQQSRFDMDEYIELQRNEELLKERWRERDRISSGYILLCGSRS